MWHVAHLLVVSGHVIATAKRKKIVNYLLICMARYLGQETAKVTF